MIEEIFSQAFIISVMAATFRIGTIFLFPVLGEIFSQRSGVVNLGIEGVMASGAATAFVISYLSSDNWLGLLAGIATGALFGLLFAFMTVTLDINQPICGILIFILGSGISTYIYRIIFGGVFVYPTIKGFESVDVPILKQIPILGSIIFQQNVLVYIAILLMLISGILLFRTSLGLRIRAVGENPRAADTTGINVHSIRYLCVIFSGMMAGLGGAYLTLGITNTFSEGMVAYRGWMAVALVIFSKWNPYIALGTSMLFGGIDALQMRLQPMFKIEPQLFLMLPYIVTIIVVTIGYKKMRPPSSLGKHYKRS